MAPKGGGGNSKAEKANAKKAENEAKKSAVASAAKEAKEAEEWSKGAKGKSKADDKADKAKEAAARKAEAARLLAEEEASLPSKPKDKASASTSSSKATSKPNPSTSKAQAEKEKPLGEIPTIESFSASGLDDALDAMTLVNEKTDNASMGSKAQQATDPHPERRFKAAFEAYKERELPQLKIDRPGLRLQQYTELLHKSFQKSPDNPFNQLTVAYNATKEDKVDVLRKEREQAKSRLQDD